MQIVEKQHDLPKTERQRTTDMLNNVSHTSILRALLQNNAENIITTTTKNQTKLAIANLQHV